ncbi:Hypothetical protein ACI5QL_04215 [Bacillus velezensis]|uniref:Uncharacterized protein n=1 Tax=Bacillus amyloliquefaciens (strain Y2) TaxID=1155777 RepID=I2CCE7_BACAY|nr:hypothetical protein MUS_4494 [Bacillus velezensis YAU B9601-Y2]
MSDSGNHSYKWDKYGMITTIDYSENFIYIRSSNRVHQAFNRK